MIDAPQREDASSRPPSAIPPAKARGRILGCLATLLGLATFGVVFFVVFVGAGRPDTYWHRIGEMQVFESEDGLVAFVEVELVTYRPGLVRSPPAVWNPVRLYRLDVGRDGTVRKVLLKSPAGQRHLLQLERILKIPQGVFLVQSPSREEHSYRLHRIEEDRVEPLSREESDPILRSLGFAGKGEGSAEEITKRNGWRLLERGRFPFQPVGDLIVSSRHPLRLRIDVSETEQALTAESFGEGDGWTAPLLSVRMRRWRSYRGPLGEQGPPRADACDHGGVSIQ